jgi:hypothetical protein
MPSDRPRLLTKNGRDFFEVSSLLQKSLRRGDVVMCARAVNELLPRYANYVWNRLMTVSAEDCADLVTGEIVALYDAWTIVQKSRKGTSGPPARLEGRIFFAKAIVLLARCRHSRDADELILLVADRLPEEVFETAMREVETVFTVDDVDLQIPEYVYDVHTRRGKRRGKTRRDFIRAEHVALADPTTIFTNFDEMAASDGYVQPRFDL